MLQTGSFDNLDDLISTGRSIEEPFLVDGSSDAVVSASLWIQG